MILLVFEEKIKYKIMFNYFKSNKFLHFNYAYS